MYVCISLITDYLVNYGKAPKTIIFITVLVNKLITYSKY